MKKNLFVTMSLFLALAFIACETGAGGNSGTQETFDATPIYRIEAPVCKADGTPDSALNVAEVNAWVNERKLPVSGTITDGVLRIGLPAIPTSYLQGASGYTAYPGMHSELTPATVKWGVLKLSYADAMGFEHIAMPGIDEHTTITLNYADRDATLTESAKDLPVKVEDMTLSITLSITLDVALNLKKGWNIIVEKQTFDMDSLSASSTAKTTDQFPAAGTWYFF
jgi:hypothetical protein